ncbi:non-canonical purine NTP pyrophosphatase [Lactobacillaceae bacterium L1_55_11]|nr:non-canonical purine NTP pyrophosphatase [Lactobacillaceae bacterium L1_55_11]
MRLVLASNNAGKTKEITTLAQEMGYQVVGYQELLGRRLDFPDETTDSQPQNAMAKAEYIHQFLPDEYILADDSGLYLAAFPERFGVVTSREFAKLGIYEAADEQSYLIDLYQGVKDRSAYLLADMALVTPDGHQRLAQAKGGVAIANHIGHGPYLGGLDNVLVAENQKILAEMDLDEVVTYHQRARALKELVATL